MVQKVTPKILPGFMELLPAEQLVFNKMVSLIASTYESFGFVPLDTPVLELSNILLAKAGGETEKQIYRFNKGDTDLCMRFDLTVPLARFVAQHQNDLTFPFKRYQISKVYRGERPQKGRFREFYQADIDIIGSEKLSVFYDAEVISIIYTVLNGLGLKDFCIHVNNRKLMNGFYEAIGVTDLSAEIMRIIDKIDKIGVENVRACLADLSLDEEKINQILDFTLIQGTTDEILGALDSFGFANEMYQQGLQELVTVMNSLDQAKVPSNHYKIDLKITRGLDYYTGTVYETFVGAYPNWGSICSGGRYDNLAGYYTDRKLPGVGMSIGLTRFFDLLRESGMLTFKTSSASDVLVLPMSENEMPYALSVAHQLRSNNLKVDVYSGETKFKNKMVYANKIGVPFVLVLGEDEVKENAVTLKNMGTGTQTQLSLEDLATYLSNEMKENKETFHIL